MKYDWSYTGENGPENWHGLCEEFSEAEKFPLQSPIGLSKEESTVDLEGCSLHFHYQEQLFTEKEFKNTFHFVPIDLKSSVTFHGEKYFLTDIHFHTPSEHILEAIHSPLEVHLVHMNALGENLVVGSLFLISDSGEEFSWEKGGHEQVFLPEFFLPKASSHFHYVGSLTTPPTKGPIHWFVFDTFSAVNFSFLELISSGIPFENNRPLQERRDRKIVYCSNKNSSTFD
ncbi:MAG: carbonic anhydrase family protein [Lactobacillales bacterium]|jgi:carbonic anhydrase|nr:carbonic anhydrase family protein [Lactobacillales bacterium]